MSPAPGCLGQEEEQSPLPFGWPKRRTPKALFPAMDLMDRLLYGQLPGIVTAPPETRGDLLRSYTAIYLQEEVRREAALRDLGLFAAFLRLAALKSGQWVNYRRLSQQIGLSEPTVKSYYQILVDMFAGFYVHAFSGSGRKRVLCHPQILSVRYGGPLGRRQSAPGGRHGPRQPRPGLRTVGGPRIMEAPRVPGDRPNCITKKPGPGPKWIS